MNLSLLNQQYTQFKLAVGSGFQNEPSHLRSFLKNIGDMEINEITEGQIQKYLTGTTPITRTYYYKSATLSGLFQFAVARGYCASNPMPKIRPKITSRFTPYIYSCEDLQKLLAATTKIRVGLVEAKTMRIVITLLYGATLRVSEALSLKVEDVDLVQGVLTINKSKFYKTRMVPISIRLRNLLVDYLKTRSTKHKSDFLFLNINKRQISKKLIGKNFIRLRKAAGVVRNKEDVCQPRLHDLRHTGAVHRIIEWYREGKDVQVLIPLLSTYMGHAELRSTQVYLTVTPEIMTSASAKFERYAFDKVVV